MDTRKRPVQSFGFTNCNRNILEENEIRLTTVGVDIGSATSHLVFSQIDLKQQGTRYLVTRRTVLSESDIQLTPYRNESAIDTEALGLFISRQYEKAGLTRQDIDTGALILTGTALRRRNARAIADLFAEEAGRFVAVTAGDGLEATLAAHGSGAVLLSAAANQVVLNIDIGGGTSKFAVCAEGKVREVTALDIGARLLVLDQKGVLIRIEEAGRRLSADAGVEVSPGSRVDGEGLKKIADLMADRLFDAIPRQEPMREHLPYLRLAPLSYCGKIDAISFSGGISEFIYAHEKGGFGDLGAQLAAAVRQRIEKLGIPVIEPAAGIRATVIGASQYTVQVSGKTIFIDPPDALPIRNVPVVVPEFGLEQDEIDPAAVKDALQSVLKKLDLVGTTGPVAIGFHWQGAATFTRLHAFCRGAKDGMEHLINRGRGLPLIFVSDGDIGGLIGLHFKEELNFGGPLISIDGVDLQELDYIDIGALIPATGSVPVVVKSLIFPAADHQTS